MRGLFMSELSNLQTKHSWRKLFRNIWLISIVTFLIPTVYFILIGEAKNNQSVFNTALFVVVLLSVIIGCLSFAVWILSIMNKKLLKTLFFVSVFLIGVFVLLLFSQNNIMGRIQIIGDTMKDYKDGSYHFICRFCKDFKRQDIVIHRSALNPDLELIGRVIGLPNETIVIEKGVVKFNGQPLSEPYTDWTEWADGSVVSITLKEDDYLTLVDKRKPFTQEFPIESRIFNMNNYRGRFF